MPSMRISVELVPRSVSALDEELQRVKTQLPYVNAINIPDIVRFSLRSWQGCAQAKALFQHTIPHLRAIDFDLSKPLAIAEFLAEAGIDEVLVISGDAPVDMGQRVYPSSSLAMIRKLKLEHPHLRVYAALDPYRQSLSQEHDYALRKLEAGADGLFTQPFFDLRLMAVYRELLAGVPVFWGVTNVMSSRSQRYWQTRNRAIFPADFAATLEWNRAFARQALAFARDHNQHIYFMPIKADTISYLQGILSP